MENADIFYFSIYYITYTTYIISYDLNKLHFFYEWVTLKSFKSSIDSIHEGKYVEQKLKRYKEIHVR